MQGEPVIIWERRVDPDKHRRNLAKFWKFYGIPAAVAIVIGGVVEGLGAAAGLAILLGLFGSMLFVAIWLTGRSKLTNTVITKEGSMLCWAARRVPLDQVERFSTFTETKSMSMVGVTGSHTNAEVHVGTARFVLTDGSEVDFAFPHLETEQLEQLRTALETVLPTRWRAISELHA